MKKVWKYLIITILLLTGLFFAGLLFLFFVPSSSIFGITFISHNERLISKDYKLENVNQIVLNSRSYDIEVFSTSSSNLSVRVEGHSLGYVTKNNSKLLLKEELTNGILTFTIVEPYGAAFKNSSKITLYIPEASKDKQISLTLSNENANVNIDSSKIYIKNLDYSAKDGNVELKNVNISGNLNLDLHKTNFYINSNAEINNANVDLKLTTGKFDASKSSLGIVNILSNERGVIKLNSCSSINQVAKTTGGRIEANNVNNISYSGSDTNIYINEINYSTTITLTNSGEIVINKLSGIAEITTNTGNITIKNCTSNLTNLSTTSKKGDISINTAYCKVFAQTTSGNITTTFAEDAGTITQADQNIRYFKAITETGKISATGVNKAEIEIKENGSLDLTYAHFNKNQSVKNIIKSNNGDIHIQVDNLSSFVLKSKINSGNSRINLSQTDKFKGWTEKEVNENINYEKNETINDQLANLIDIDITGSGNLLMHDNKVN